MPASAAFQFRQNDRNLPVPGTILRVHMAIYARPASCSNCAENKTFFILD